MIHHMLQYMLHKKYKIVLFFLTIGYNMLHIRLKKSIVPFKNRGVTYSNMSRTIVKYSNFSVT
jgi:hypothetical protein